MHRALCVAAAGLSIACSSEPNALVDVHVTATTVVVTPVSHVELYVLNQTASPVEFRGCPNSIPVEIQRRVGHQWEDAGSLNVFCTANLIQTSLVLAPGDSVATYVQANVLGEYRFRVLYAVRAAGPLDGRSPFSARVLVK